MAAVLGVTQPVISDVVRGRQGSIDVLARWASLWAAAGHGRYRLVVEPEGVRVERMEPGPPLEGDPG